jgi:hypothetical protein
MSVAEPANRPRVSLFGSSDEWELEKVEYRIFPAFDSALCALADGTEVHSFENDGQGVFLLIDHRRDPALPARAELWRLCSMLEVATEGLYILCEARTSMTA